MGFDATVKAVPIPILMLPCPHGSLHERRHENYQEICHETSMKARDSARRRTKTYRVPWVAMKASSSAMELS